MHNTSPLLLPVSIVVDSDSLARMTDGRPWVKHLFILVWLALVALTFVFVYTSAPDLAMERACTAVLSLGLSLFVFSRFWSEQSFLPIFAFFALRGATLSIVFTLLLEIYAQFFSFPLLSRSSSSLLTLFFTMLLVGVKEESAKLLSVLLGSSLSPVALQSIDSCCSSYVPSPRRLALYGVSVGFGFMLLENVEYFIIVDLMPGNSSDAAISRILTGLLRSLFNLHPLLTGLVSARLAHIVFARPAHFRHTHVLDWLLALWPSVLIHGLYDFLASLPEWAIFSNSDSGVSGLVLLAAECGLVVGTWALTRALFHRSLKRLGSPEEVLSAAVSN